MVPEQKSLDFNAKDAMKALKELGSPEEIQAFIEGDERKSVLDAAQKLLDGPGESAPAQKPKKEKEPTDEQIIDAYDSLLDLLTRKQAIEMKRKRRHLHYFVHFRKITRYRLLFLRTTK